jgi:hypothetical protein
MAKEKVDVVVETQQEREENERLKAEASARIAFLELQLRRLVARGELAWKRHS